MKQLRPLLTATLSLFTVASPALADPPVIEDVKLRAVGGSWTISVTLSHPDTGWDHYADGWRVLSPSGEELGMRVLHHPHVEEQPFTRSLSGVTIPADLHEIQIEARDNKDGWVGTTKTVPLP